jgi:hypothetical protein
LGGTGHTEDHTSGSTNIDHHVGFPEGDLEQHQTINAHTTAETDHLPSSVERRSRQPPIWLRDYDSGEGFSDEDHQGNFALFVDADPLSYEDAARSNKWRCVMETEILAIKKNNTWDLTDLPRGATIVGVKWINKTKLNEHGEVDKYKACLVAKGYT